VGSKDLTLGRDNNVGGDGGNPKLTGNAGRLIPIDFDGDESAVDGLGDIGSAEDFAFHPFTWWASIAPKVDENEAV
jgi:hypothetical protein